MAYADLVRRDGASSLYLMDEATGVFMDSIGGRHLTPTGTFNRNQDTIPKKPAAGLLPDGYTGFGSSDSQALSSSDNISIEAWVIITGTSHWGAIAHVGAAINTDNGVSFGINAGSTGFEAAVAGNYLTVLYDGVRWVPSTYQLAVGRHHLVITRTTGLSTLVYDNGVLATTVIGGDVPAAPSGGKTFVGGYITGGSSQFARVCNFPVGAVAFYPVALSAVSIANHYREGLREGVSY